MFKYKLIHNLSIYLSTISCFILLASIYFHLLHKSDKEYFNLHCSLSFLSQVVGWLVGWFLEDVVLIYLIPSLFEHS